MVQNVQNYFESVLLTKKEEKGSREHFLSTCEISKKSETTNSLQLGSFRHFGATFLTVEEKSIETFRNILSVNLIPPAVIHQK